MGKHGPCYHCGVTSTPLWRNGPPDKPVLCNACGSRWRTKGTLVNYTPLHARGPLEEEFKVFQEKNLSFSHKGHNTHKKKKSSTPMITEFENKGFNENFQKGLDDDLSDGSSSGSAGSYSDSCAHFGDMSEVTGSFQSNIWDSLVPSKRRSGLTRSKPSSVEKLTKDLHSILHQQSSYLSVSSSDLLYETGTPMDATEIGHGVQLLKKSSSVTKDEESEASSFPKEKKLTQSGLPLSVCMKSEDSCVPSTEIEKYSKLKSTQEHLVRERPSQEKIHALLNKDSYLASADLKHLIKEGVYDLSLPGINTEQCSKLKKVALTDLTKAELFEQNNMHKDGAAKPIWHKEGSSSTLSLKRSHGSLMGSLSESTVKCSKKLCKNKLEELPMKISTGYSHEAGDKLTEGTTCGIKEFSRVSPRSLSASSSHKSCIMDNLELADSNNDEDLLLDVRSNTSFPEAELLSRHWLQKAESFCEESGVSEKEGSLCCNSSLSFNGNQLKHL